MVIVLSGCSHILFQCRVTLDFPMKERWLHCFEPQVLSLLKYLKRQGELKGFVGLSLPIPAALQETIKVGAHTRFSLGIENIPPEKSLRVSLTR